MDIFKRSLFCLQIVNSLSPQIYFYLTCKMHLLHPKSPQRLNLLFYKLKVQKSYLNLISSIVPTLYLNDLVIGEAVSIIHHKAQLLSICKTVKLKKKLSISKIQWWYRYMIRVINNSTQK